MMRVAVYDTATGQILRIVLCPAAATEMQARAGEAVLEVGPEVSDDTHEIVDGVAVTL